MPDRVAVIGAGALGLMCMKNFKDDGFDVVGYETRDYVGGLWKDSHDSTISVHPTTVFNSSKFRAAISDFPFPDEADDFPTAAQLHKYLVSYAGHFEVTPLVQLSTRVEHITRDGSQWALEVKSNSTGQTRVDYFDRVCIATGSFFTPRFPSLPDLDKFKGKVIHSIDFHNPDDFKDQNVLLIGMHATAQDVTNALSKSAKRVYLAHRSGVLLLPRYDRNGIAFDISVGTRFIFLQAFLSKWAPSLFHWLFDTATRCISQASFPIVKESWNMRPTPSLAVSTPLIGDIIYPLMQRGFAEPVTAVKAITAEREVELTDGRVISDIDSIIYCTGYHFNIPENLVPNIPIPTSTAEIEAEKTGRLETIHPYPFGSESLGAPARLYRGIFPLHPDPAVRDSVAFAGHSAIIYPGFVQFELVAMAISQIWLGKSQLPSYHTMLAWYDGHRQHLQKLSAKYRPNPNSTFYSVMMPLWEHLPWLDATAGTGFFDNLQHNWLNWRSWKLWLQDREAYDLCMNAVPSPMIFRLFDTGKRKAMDRDEWKKSMRLQDQRAKLSRERKVKQLEEEKRKQVSVNGSHSKQD